MASGMQWLDQGACTALEHPPLGRVAAALGPFLKGLRSHSLPRVWDEGNAILYADGKYWQNLTLARLGNLPFLMLGSVVVFLWGRRWFSTSAGLWAVLLFTSLPPILGHAGLATLDMACAATMAAALYQLVRWLENPAWGRSVVFGGALGLAFLSRFSSLAFLAACGAGAVICLAAVQPRTLFASGRLSLQPDSSFRASGIAPVARSPGGQFAASESGLSRL